MAEALYRITLVLTGLMNLGMAVVLLRHTSRYVKYPTYRITRILTVIWLTAFGLGYMLHAAFVLRNTWPTAASALTVTYFHIGALCFSWGYTSLLNPTYMKKFVVVRDLTFFVVGLLIYWSVAFLWKDAPNYTFLSFCVFFAYALWIVIVFYRTYNRVSYRMMKMSIGSVGSFVRWMQVCCDMIVLFGIGSVTITGIFANALLPFVLLLCAGVGMFGYIVYSLEKYGEVIDDATRTAIHVARWEKAKKEKDNKLRSLNLLLMALAMMSAMTLTSCSCKEEPHAVRQKVETDSLLNAAHKAHDYEKILQLADVHEQEGRLSRQKACYWRGYAYSSLRKMRMAEQEWKEAVSQDVVQSKDLEYYAKSANRLAGLLYMKFDYESTIRVAVPAMKLLEEKGYTDNTDYANLLAFVGNCQLKLGNLGEASTCYAKAYDSYLQLTHEGEHIDNYTSSIIGILNIVYAYIQTGHYQEASNWTDHFETMLERYGAQGQANERFFDKQWARLHFFRAWILAGLGRQFEAERAYQTALNTRYAQTGEGKIDATNYLMTAHRWAEAAHNFEMIAALLEKYDTRMTVDNIHTYLLPKYIANMEANRTDSALAVGRWICSALDTAIVRERQNDAMELAAIYDMQVKETEIAEQKVTLSNQRFMSTVATLILIVFAFCLFIYFRHQAAMRLESAYHDLEIANARAEESSRMKSEFIRQISHEIRTPLNILSGYSQIITKSDMDIDESTRKNINQQITENTNRITGLVNKMLEMSDAKSMTVIEKTDTIPAVQVASAAVDDSQITNAGHLVFDMQVSPEVESVQMKTNELAATRALSLLLDNARKFTAPPEALVQKGLATVQETKQHVTLRLQLVDNAVFYVVEDTGIGVPDEEADHIFEEFVQLDEYYNGTGIGLTVARSLARRLGGDVVLDTTYTDGARFVMMLPTA